MSIFDRHKDGRAPERIPAEQTPDAALTARLEDAVARQDWHNAWRYHRESGQALPGNGDAVLPLARYLESENRPDDALALLNGFAARHPAHPDIIKNYLLAAHIMRVHFGDRAGAKTLLERLAQNYPDHPDFPLIEAQLQEEAP